MNLALPGVDACDSMKTTVTLTLFSTILSWLPMKSRYSDSDAKRGEDIPQLYISLTNISANGESNLEEGLVKATVEAKDSLDVLATTVGDFALDLLDRIFVVLEAHEEPQSGRKGTAVDGGIGGTVGHLFQAVDPVLEPLLWSTITSKILDYFQHSTPINAVKVSGKIIECIINANPSSLSQVLAVLLDKKVVENCSPDKLAFRLRLVGGATRSSQGYALVEENLTVLKPFLTSEYTHHSEKNVRKAACKLIKDILKGSVSFYPKGIQPYDSKLGLAIGAPNSYEHAQFSWYIPSASTMTAGASLLRTTILKTIADMRDMITSLAAPDIESTLTLKKVEEAVAYGLKLVQKVLRGAAEVLGDEHDSNLVSFPSLSTEESVSEMELTGDEIVDPFDCVPAMIHTARTTILEGLNEEDRALYSTLRFTAADLLAFLNDSLQGISKSSPKNGVVAVEGVISTVSAYAGLYDSSVLQGSWAKTLKVLICSRMAALKSVDQIKSWFTSIKRGNRSLVVKTMIRAIRTRESLTKGPGGVGMRGLDYWLGHDVCTNNVANSGWLQHAIRQKHFATLSNKHALTQGTKSPVLLSLLNQLIDLTCHEYDVVRQKALSTFVHITGKFGKKSYSAVKNLISVLTVPGTTFERAIGIFYLLGQHSMMKGILSKWEEIERFLRALTLCPTMIAKIEQQDKKQILMGKMANLFVKYVESWHHFPLDDTSSRSATSLYQLLLSTVGFDLDGKLLTDRVQMIIGDEEEGAAGSSSSGLRHTTFLAFMMLHFIGHDDITVPTGVVAWALQTVSTEHGQPTQLIAMAALVRTTYILCKKISPSLLLSPQSPQPVTPISFATINYFRSIFSPVDGKAPLGNAQVGWVPFLLGISQAHPRREEGAGGAQWSQGIDHVLRCSEYLNMLLPRLISSNRSEGTLFSTHFRLSHAGLFLSLAPLLTSTLNPPVLTTSVTTTTTIPSNNSSVATTVTSESESTLVSLPPLSPLAMVSAALEACKSLVSTSEDESRANNSTRAELFGGLLRGVLSLQKDAANSESEKNTTAVEELLVAFFVENVERLSVDYFADWAEAVYFVFSCGLCKMSNPLCCLVLDGFRRILISGETEEVEKEEGFARQGRVLTLTRAALSGEINACSSLSSGVGVSDGSSPPTSISPLAVALTQLLSEEGADFLSPFRNCRLEFGKMFSLLSESGAQTSVGLTAVLSKISSAVMATGVNDISTEVAKVVIEEQMVVDGMVLETVKTLGKCQD
jgi:hypothetical protein